MRALKPFEGSVTLGFDDDLYCESGDHIAYFWESDADFDRGVRFLEVGLNGNDACVIFGHEEANERVLDLLRSKGFLIDALLKSTRLAVLGAQSTGEATLQNIAETFGRQLAAGAGQLRLLGNIGWGRPGWPSEKDILAFESRVTSAIAELPCVVVCMYDVNALPGRVMVHGAIETHPLTFVRNVLRENPHHVPMDQYLASLPQPEDERF